MKFSLSNKGQLNAETLLAVPIMLLMLYISLEIMNVVNTNVLFPLLDNTDAVAYGSTVKLLVQLIPLILIMLIVIGVWMSAKYRSQQIEY